MSAIEYRAWCRELQKMLPVTMIDFYTKEISVFGAYPPDEFLIKMRPKMITRDVLDFADVELMRKTGLKDQNNVEIFESDIIKQINNKGGNPYHFIGVVEYDITGFCVRCLKGAEINSYYSFSHFDNESKILKKAEVIGNIYENSEK